LNQTLFVLERRFYLPHGNVALAGFVPVAKGNHLTGFVDIDIA
jgi:hypothetical protein